MNIITFKESKKNKPHLNWKFNNKPNLLGVKLLNNNCKEFKDYIDWTPFFNSLGLKGRYPNIFKKEKVGIEAEKVYYDALNILKKIENNKLLNPKSLIGIYPANSDEENIIIYENEERNKIKEIIPTLRQQHTFKGKNKYYSLSDFISPKNIKNDYIGLFTLTVGDIDNIYKNIKDPYDNIIYRLVVNRLTEAYAEFLHKKIRKEIWGYSKNENLTNDELIKGRYYGIRPAPGYPSCPDHSLKEQIFNILKPEIINVYLTKNYLMKPLNSISAFVISHKDSKYFNIPYVKIDQVKEYNKYSKYSLDNNMIKIID